MSEIEKAELRVLRLQARKLEMDIRKINERKLRRKIAGLYRGRKAGVYVSRD